MTPERFFEYTGGITVFSFITLYSIGVLWSLVALIAVIGLSLALGVIGARIMTRMSDNVQVLPTGKAVFVTGCDIGYGRDLAVELAKRGFKVFAGMAHYDPHRQDKLMTMANVTVLDLDTRQEEDVLEAAKKAREQDAVLWAVVLAEGVGYIGEVEWEAPQNIHKMHDINVFGALRVARAFMPLLRRSRGRIVTVGGYAGRLSFPGMVPYCMTKSAVIALSDGLRRECTKWGILVSVIHPFYYKTYDTVDLHSAPSSGRRRSSVHNLQIPPDILSTLGDDYLLNYRQQCERRLELFARHNKKAVVDAMVDAVSHIHPKTYYECVGPLDGALWWVVEAMPIEFQDFCMNKMLGRPEGKKSSSKLTRRRQSAITIPLAEICGSSYGSPASSSLTPSASVSPQWRSTGASPAPEVGRKLPPRPSKFQAPTKVEFSPKPSEYTDVQVPPVKPTESTKPADEVKEQAPPTAVESSTLEKPPGTEEPLKTQEFPPDSHKEREEEDKHEPPKVEGTSGGVEEKKAQEPVVDTAPGSVAPEPPKVEGTSGGAEEKKAQEPVVDAAPGSVAPEPPKVEGTSGGAEEKKAQEPVVDAAPGSVAPEPPKVEGAAGGAEEASKPMENPPST